VPENFIIEQDEQQKNSEDFSSNKSPIWTPLRDGKIFQNYLISKKKISEKDKKAIEQDTVELLGKCIYPNNIIETDLKSTGLCFGQIQSGKTTSMESAFSLAADNNYKILILLTGSVGPLVIQNTDRIDKILDDRKFEVLRNVEDEWDYYRHLEILKNNIFDWNNPDTPDEDKKTLVILSMKNPSRIRKIIKLFKDASNNDVTKYSKVPALIVDDECDHHSLNSNASKNDPDLKDERELYQIKPGDTLETICEMAKLDLYQLFEINPGVHLKERFDDYIGHKINIEKEDTATHIAITNLRKQFKFHSFLGYTATPNASLVISTFNHLSPSFGKIISPGEEYTGLEYFFSAQSKIDRFVRSIDEQIAEKYEKGNERPPSLEDAYLYFLTCVSCALYQGRENTPDKQNMSMIVHPSGLTDIHEKYLNWIRGMQDEIRAALRDKNSEKFKELEIKIKKHLNDIKKFSKSDIPNTDKKFWQLFQGSKCLGRPPIPFNASRKFGRKRIPPVDYRRNYANILVGGHGLDRGYTVEGLTVTFLCRPLGGKQEDTLLQRARFMGYQGKNSDFLRLYLDDDVLGFFDGEYDRNRNLMKVLSRFLEKNENFKNWRRFWIGRDRTEFKLTRPGVINDIYLSRRSEPYDRSIRCRWSHLIEDGSLEQNRKFYKNITTKFGNQFKQLREIDGVAEKYSWTKNQNIKVMSNVYLSEVNAEILGRFEFETRDMDSFSVLMALIDNYMDPIKRERESDDEYFHRKHRNQQTICPIFIFRDGEKNARKPWTDANLKSPSSEETKKGPVTTQQGQATGYEKERDKSMFPGDIRIHWEFINSISNNMACTEIPSLQIHEINVYEKPNGTGDILFPKVPYLSFFMPRAMFEEVIVGVPR